MFLQIHLHNAKIADKRNVTIPLPPSQQVDRADRGHETIFVVSSKGANCVNSFEVWPPRGGELGREPIGVASQRGVIIPLPPAPNTKPPLSPSTVLE